LNNALSFQIFDYNEIRKDRLLGTANFDLKQLEEDAEHENVTEQVTYNAKSRGEVTFDVRYYPVLKPKKPNKLRLRLQAESLPLPFIKPKILTHTSRWSVP
jgi:Ca2+-dependent lipid-binding protein